MDEPEFVTEARKQIASVMAITPYILKSVGNVQKAMINIVKRAHAIPPRIRHLAARHGNPRVRKKNRKRILKMLRGK